jgi:hypothetical protein
MAEENAPTRDLPWVRVRDQFGHELDRHYQDPGVLDGTFEVIKEYPPNQTAQARPTKYRTTTQKAGPKPATEVKGQELADRLEAAGLTEATAGLTADEKRQALAAHEAAHEPDPSQEG